MRRNFKDGGRGGGTTSKQTNGKSKNNNKQDITNQQQKITSFFKKTISDDAGPSERSPYFKQEKNTIKQCTKSTNNNINSKPHLNFDGEVILVEDSDSESEKDKSNVLGPKKNLRENCTYIKAQDPIKLGTIEAMNNENNISSFERKKDKNILEIETSGLTPETDSGEEFLSQLDIDEIIISQEDRITTKTVSTYEVEPSSSSDSTTPKKSNALHQTNPSPAYQTPTKSPKPKVNKFSPLSHLAKNKRSRSQSSVSSNRSNSNSPSPSRKSSPFRRHGSEEIRTPVKKLQYFNPMPYYLKNFLLVIDSVAQDDHNAYLLNEDDRETVHTFKRLSLNAQCLYVRLFQRKWEWKVATSIKYPQIAEDLFPVFTELYAANFVIEIKEHTPDLECLLDLLSGEQIVSLSKQMKVDPSKKSKLLCKNALIKSTQNQKTLFGSSSDILVRRALNILGSTYQVEKDRKDLFSRLFILYSPPQYWEDEQDQTTNNLLKMLMNDIGQMQYPAYTINKTTKIYSNRNSLIRFHEAWSLHCDISSLLESKCWDDVIEITKTSLSQLQDQLIDEVDQEHDTSLPAFLRVYTAGSVLTRVSWLGVDGFQKLKKYDKANEIIELLLSQECYLPHYRGRWYERSVINMQHLKIPTFRIKCALEAALSDPYVQDSHKLSLSDRLLKLNDKRKVQLNKSKSARARTKKGESQPLDLTQDEDDTNVHESLFRLRCDTPSRTIEGEKMDNSKGKSVFIGERDSSGSSTASSVELFAAEHYKTLGYKYGIHAEGSVVTSVYGLIFWDEIYNDQISDAFHAQYQAFPLDMHFEDFYKRREASITQKLTKLRSTWSMDDCLQIMEVNWEKYFNVLSIVSWNVFPNIEKAKTLVKAMGLQITAAICERLARNYRHYRSGFPDLVVWNEEDFMFVEVKGPGDSLSAKQMIWIDFLLSIGAKAEVCHVIAVSNKRIRIEK